MATRNNNAECVITCWAIAALVGLVAMVMLYAFADFSVIQAIFTGGLAGTILGGVLSLTICRPQTAADDLASADKPAKRYAAKAAERMAASGAVQAPAAAGATGAVAEAAGVAAGSAGVAAGSAGVAAGSAGSSAGVSASATRPASSVGGPVAGTVPAGAQDTTAPSGNMAAVNTTPSTALSMPVETAPVAKPAPKAKVPAKTAAPKAAKSADDKPAVLLGAARPEGKDDLKRISGVGPKLEQTLNDLGIYHFDQVAKFKKKDIAWVDERLRFKGRIERDDWMSQAKILAKGGETDFSKRSKKT